MRFDPSTSSGRRFVRPSTHSAQREFLKLNDEHQGEGGTLVFVAPNITTTRFSLQDPKY